MPRRPTLGRTIAITATLGLICVIAAVILAGASKAPSAADTAEVEALISSGVQEFHAGAAIAPEQTVKGSVSEEVIEATRSASLERLSRLMVDEALAKATTNLDDILAVEGAGSAEVVNSGKVDQVILDELDVETSKASAKGRVHGYTEFRDVVGGELSRAQSWEYFDASLIRSENGRWMIADLRIIPTLDDIDSIAPYPANGDPAE